LFAEEVNFEFKGVHQKFRLTRDEEKRAGNFFTLISGENGVGKSLLLRALVDAALTPTSQSFSSNRTSKASATFSGGPPSRILALSGTTNDRFPNNSGADLRLSVNKFDVSNFYYFGPRHAGGIASSARAASSISQSIVSLMISGGGWSKGAHHLLHFLGLTGSVVVKLQPHQKVKKNVDGYIREMTRRLSDITEKFEGEQKERIDAAKFSLSILQEVDEKDVFRVPGNWPMRLRFESSNGRIYPERDHGYLFESLLMTHQNDWPKLTLGLISIGLLKAEIEFSQNSDEHDSINLDEMSSGQWQLINCLFNLAASVRDNSLILIDEPENSLHPQWQKNYISLVREIISHTKGCHVLIATHSPMLVTSLLPHDGALLSLTKEQNSSQVDAEIEGSAYGWLPGDALKGRFDLDTQRAPELTKAINAALYAIRKNDKQSSDLKNAKRRISHLRSSLPVDDPINLTLDAIIEFKVDTKNE
jgi:predicted ATPase